MLVYTLMSTDAPSYVADRLCCPSSKGIGTLLIITLNSNLTANVAVWENLWMWQKCGK